MSGRFRLPEGGRVDRDRRFRFTFDGKSYPGLAGDSLASALLANGVHLAARSFKYHRPRGILTAGVEEPSALVQLETGGTTDPNSRAPVVELYDGLRAASQNNWPTLSHDLGEVAQLAARLLPAGFYYKTFMWPARAWRYYEYVIRHAAGMGRAPAAPDPARYEKTYAHCDVLVVGAGPAGLAAALSAGRSGARVILVDEQNELGGALLADRAEIDGKPALDWVTGAAAALAAMDEVRVLTRTTAFAYYDHNYLALLERITDHLGPDAELPAGLPRQRLWKVRARRVVLATGAIERPLVFADNDRPGIMLAGAARTYLNRYGVKTGGRAVVLTNNDSAYLAASDLRAAGLSVTVADLRADGAAAPTAQAAAERGVEILTGQGIVETGGRRRVNAVKLGRLDETPGVRILAGRRIECDLVCMSGGWNPTTQLYTQSGGTLAFDQTIAAFVPDRATQPVVAAGACRGSFGLGDCLGEGDAAGIEAAAAAGFKAAGRKPRRPTASNREVAALLPVWLVPGVRPVGRGGKYFVDFQNDVTAADLDLAVRESYISVEHVKRYTTTGMGTDQGKTGNVNALALQARARGEAIPAVGATTARAPYTPVTFGGLAGRDIGALADPIRKSAMHGWHAQAGAVFEDVGQWKRPFYYPRPGERMDQAVNREAEAVRDSLGILDATTLGKIDIQGADAAEFLNMIYTNGWKTLQPGRCRYGLMLHEDGFIFDDGVTARLAENHFLMHTTSTGAANVLAWLEEWLQTEWPALKVYCTSVTEQFAVANIAGPNAGRLLAELGDDLELGAEAFPHMSVRSGTVAGIPARVFRVSFTGEASYEINVAASYGLALWTALMAAGEKYAITPFGTECLHVLRAEKGYIMVGQDTDGTMTPADVGMGRMASTRKDFLGRRSLVRPDMQRADRKQLVGLLTDDPREVLPEGAHVAEPDAAGPPTPHLGHVTSSYWSPNLGRSIAMAVIRDGFARMGDKLTVPLLDRRVAATVTGTVFYDPEGARLNG